MAKTTKKKKGRGGGGGATDRFIRFGADIERALELVDHAWNERAFQVRKVRDDEERACVLVPPERLVSHPLGSEWKAHHH
jgi:hypothetical protein